MPEPNFEPKYRGQAFPEAEAGKKTPEQELAEGTKQLLEMENNWGRNFASVSKIEIPDSSSESGKREVPLGAEFEFFNQDNFNAKRDEQLGITIEEVEINGEKKKIPVSGQENIPDNPGFDYSKLNPEQLKTQHENLLRLKGEILGSLDRKKELLKKRREVQGLEETDIVEVAELEKLQVVRILYLQSVNEALARNRMLQATLEGDNKRFQRYSEFIYGKPSQESFRTALDMKTQVNVNLLDQARGELKEKNPEIAAEIEKAAQEALDLVQNDYGVDISTFAPRKVETKEVTGEDISAEEIAAAIAPAIDRMNEKVRQALKDPNFEGLRVIYDAKRGNAAIVKQYDEAGNMKGADLFLAMAKKKVENPNLEAGAWVKTIAHEIDSHYARMVGGRATGLHIMAGADRAWKIEEGLATFGEQKYEGILDVPAEERKPGGIGAMPGIIAVGMSGEKGLKFRELYEATVKLNKPLAIKQAMLAGRSNQEIMAWAEAACRRVAYYRTFRTLRGTTGEGGGAYTKDHIYFSGNEEVLDILKTQGERGLARLRIGMVSPDHLRYTAMLGLQEPDTGDQLFEDNIVDLVRQNRERAGENADEKQQ